MKLIDQDWSVFLTHTLRYSLHTAQICVNHCHGDFCSVRFKSTRVLNLAAVMVAVLSRVDSATSDMALPDLKELYLLLWSHSEFETALSNSRDNKTKGVLILVGSNMPTAFHY